MSKNAAKFSKPFKPGNGAAHSPSPQPTAHSPSPQPTARLPVFIRFSLEWRFKTASLLFLNLHSNENVVNSCFSLEWRFKTASLLFLSLHSSENVANPWFWLNLQFHSGWRGRSESPLARVELQNSFSTYFELTQPSSQKILENSPNPYLTRTFSRNPHYLKTVHRICQRFEIHRNRPLSPLFPRAFSWNSYVPCDCTVSFPLLKHVKENSTTTLIIAHSHISLFLAKHRVTSAYFVAKFRFDIAENELRKEWCHPHLCR